MTDEDRMVEAEIEVPGTPEEVWEAIATGPGITAWFVPTDVEERPGGTVSQYHGEGPGMRQTADITAWEPPTRFAYETEWAPDEGVAPRRMASEFLVEAKAGGTCVVRVVNRGFGDGEEWDRALEGTRGGWGPALTSLRLYLEHFAGQAAAPVSTSGPLEGARADAWRALLDALGMPDAGEGDRVAASADGAPEIAGTVEFARDTQMILRLERPAPGLGMVGVGGPGATAFGFLRAQLFGDGAAAIAAREQGAWKAWMAGQSS